MSFIKEIRTNKILYGMALPGIVFLAIFAYLPMVGHLLAFKRFQISDGIWGSPWVGFDNFKFFFGSDAWYKVTWNTLMLNAFFIVSSMVFAVTIAILLNEIRVVIYKKLCQSLIFMPYFISWMVVSLMVFALINTTDGFINRTLESFGNERINFYNSPDAWPWLLTIIYVWKFTGYKAVIFLAAITGISEEYYESARIDGASRLQQIIRITLPMIRPVIIVLTLLAVGRIFYGDFGMIYGIVGDNGMLFPTTDIIDTYSFRSLRQLGNFGMASAVVLYQSLLGLITIIGFNYLVKRIDPDSKLF